MMHPTLSPKQFIQITIVIVEQRHHLTTTMTMVIIMTKGSTSKNRQFQQSFLRMVQSLDAILFNLTFKRDMNRIARMCITHHLFNMDFPSVTLVPPITFNILIFIPIQQMLCGGRKGTTKSQSLYVKICIINNTVTIYFLLSFLYNPINTI